MKRAVGFLLMCALIWLPLPAYPQNSEVIIIRRPKLGSSSHTFTHTSNYAFTPPGSTVVVLPNNPTLNDIPIGCFLDYNNGSNTPPTVTVSDGAGNAYAVVGPAGGLQYPNYYNAFAYIFYMLSAPANADKTLTITASSTVGYSAIFADEFTPSGAGPVTLDASATNNASNTLPVAALGTGTNDLFYSCVTNNNSLTGAGGLWVGTGAPHAIFASSYWATYILNATASTAVDYTSGDGGSTTAVVTVSIR
jgi:hypothetical protein